MTPSGTSQGASKSLIRTYSKVGTARSPVRAAADLPYLYRASLTRAVSPDVLSGYGSVGRPDDRTGSAFEVVALRSRQSGLNRVATTRRPKTISAKAERWPPAGRSKFVEREPNPVGCGQVGGGCVVAAAQVLHEHGSGRSEHR